MDAAAMKAALDRFTGSSSRPEPGCAHLTVPWGQSEALIEAQYEPPSGDGWHEPYHAASITVIGVLVNGTWCSPEDVAPESVIDAWTRAAEAHQAEAVESYWHGVAQARAEERLAA